MAQSSNSSLTAAAAAAALLAPVASDVTEAVLPVTAADTLLAPVASEVLPVTDAATLLAPAPSEAQAVLPFTAATTLLAPVASEAQAVLPAASTDLEAELGSQRPVLDKDKLAGTVGFHERHVFLCYKGPEEWPSHLEVEATESDRLPWLLAAAIRARESNLKKKIKLTICEEDGTESSLGDVLIFPDMIRYRGLTHFDVDNFVEEVLVKDVEWLPGSAEAIRGSYIFVCAHGSRDKRCGVCGPALITRFKEEIEGQGLDGQVAVSACSHVGGHKYAGNVIIFSSDAKGEVTGHWYGYVAPDDVPVLLQKHIAQGEIVDHLWRGQMVFSKEQHKALKLKQKTSLDLNFSPLSDTQEEPEPSKRVAESSLYPELGLAQNETKLLLPEEYDGDASLSGSELHHFAYAKEVKHVIDKTTTWLSAKLSLALVKNGNLFAVEAKHVCDFLFHAKGAICVVDNEQLPQVTTTTSLYSTSITATLKDHQPEDAPVSGLLIIKTEFGGNRWRRRKYSLQGDSSYHVLQWLPRLSDTEFQDKLKRRAKGKGPEEEGVESSRESRAYKGLTHTVDDFSIRNCIYTTETMQELSLEEKAKAFDIFRTELNREIFMCAEPATRLIWLRKQIMAIPD